MSHQLLDGLNELQRAAVTFGDGPLLVLAGAGSGKTRVLTSRIARLVSEEGVEPGRILAVTFTNKAAGEMRSRIEELIGGHARHLWLGTFHAVGLRILRSAILRSGGPAELTIYGDDEQLALVKEVFAELGLSDKALSPRAVLSRISQAKNEGLGPAEFAASASDFFGERVAKVYDLYQRKLRAMRAYDFGDLLCEPVRLLREDGELLESYSRRFRHILIDEFQDTNRVQHTLTTMLASAHRNVCAVGDPDQSIYAWRGADIRNILDFEKTYPDATVLRLEQNYRSTRTILQAANSVIARNRGRFEKTLWTDNDHGEPVTYEEARDEYHEAELVAAAVRELAAAGEPYRSMAVFYRTNAQSRVLEERFMREGLPYTIVGGLKFYDRMEIRDVLAYLRVAANRSDAVSLGRIVNTPPRGVGKTTMERVRELAGRRGLTLYDAFVRAAEEGLFRKGGKVKRLLECFEDFTVAHGRREAPLHELALRLLEDCGYMEMWLAQRSDEAMERVENIYEFLSAARDFEAANPEAGLDDFLDHVSLISDIDTYDEEADRVTLMTVHAAKGLEFPHVFIIGLEEGLFPHSRSMDSEEDVEEERRLFYVAMTRAERRLHLLSASSRSLFGETRYQLRSRFVDEIAPQFLEVRRGERAPAPSPPRTFGGDEPYYTSDGADAVFPPESAYVDEPAGPSLDTAWCVGALVRHPSFGVGTIKAREGAGEQTRLTVKFRGAGVKKLYLKYAALEPLSP
ncbi:MAG TPA: hypothetical protein ENJ37_02275 [Deltaproteobacteria bacterium]|nr:hypothetical protein [Deltaproteobacteria bacterium]